MAGLPVSWMPLMVAGFLGLVVGSASTVAIERWPSNRSLGHPARSSCPTCESQLRWWQLVPVLSWLTLRGRCAHCGQPIALMYPAVEMLTCVAYVAATFIWWPSPVLGPILVVCSALIVSSWIDLRHRIIPNRLTLRLPVVLLILLSAVAFLDDGLMDLRRAVIAGVAVPAVMFAISELFRLIRGQAGMGMGDIKLCISLGLMVGYLGPWQLVVFAYGTIAAAMLVVFVLVLFRRVTLATRIPFGPYLAVGAALPIFAEASTTNLVKHLLGFA